VKKTVSIITTPSTNGVEAFNYRDDGSNVYFERVEPVDKLLDTHKDQHRYIEQKFHGWSPAKLIHHFFQDPVSGHIFTQLVIEKVEEEPEVTINAHHCQD